jgi:hypothetical protein
MQYLSIIEPPSVDAIRVFAEKRNLSKYFSSDYIHPQEDYLLSDPELSVFVVADGVTLSTAVLFEFSYVTV